MSAFGRARDRPSRKVSPPSATYMSNDQFANYLAELRDHRVSRPGGARPLPSRGSTSSNTTASVHRDAARVSIGSRVSFAAPSAPAAPRVANTDSTVADAPLPAHQRSQSDAPSVTARPSLTGTQSIAGSMTSRYSSISGRGRDYYPDHAAAKPAARPLRPDEIVPTDTYMERGQRWMEKEEAVSLRHALEDMDLKDHQAHAEAHADAGAGADADEQRIYKAALDEAAELVWQHQNGVKPPEPGAPYRYKQHLRKNSYAYARTASVGRYGNDIEPTGLARDPASRSVSGSSSASSAADTTSVRQSLEQTRSASFEAAVPVPGVPLRSKPYNGLTAAGPRPMVPAAKSTAAAATRRRSSMKRNISGEIEKPFSGDQIYEEPETGTPDRRAPAAGHGSSGGSGSSSGGVLQAKPESTVNSKEASTPAVAGANGIAKLVSRYEIHRNAPSQSRNPHYTTNEPAPPSKPNGVLNGAGVTAAAAVLDVPRKNGVEIRSEEIRQATSMKLKDRNQKLPTPSFVSDSPGRPIVSFDANWKAPVDEAATDARPDVRDKSCGSGGGGGNSSGADRNGSRMGQGAPVTITPTKIHPKNIFARRHHHNAASAAVPPAADLWSAPTVPPQQHTQQRQRRQQQEQQEQHEQHEQQKQQQQQQQQQPAPQQRPQARNIFSRPAAAPVKSGSTAVTGAVPSSVPGAILGTGVAVPVISVTEDATPLSTRATAPIPTISVTEDPLPRPTPPSIPSISVSEEPAPRRQPPIPSISVSAEPTTRQPPLIPSISVSEEPATRPQPSIPSISVSEEPATHRQPSMPSISVSEEPASRRPPASIPQIVLPVDDSDPAAPVEPRAPAATHDVPSILIPGHGSRQSPAVPPIPTVVADVNRTGGFVNSRALPDPVSRTPRALPSPAASARPLPTPTSAGRSYGHWSRAPAHAPGPLSSAGSVAGRSRATARCHECGLPIEGRFIALAGIPGAASGSSNGSERFHPECFRCYSCGTSLEALEISPEPDEFRSARLDRIARRARGEVLDEAPGETMGEDGDARLRFYCHLDWHELFAPHCKHCKTPIVGEHVVALGAHWHVGHFFCAECGDPFGPGATHIEKDGYAWCVACQTKRTERRAPKCRACGRAVIGQYVQALAAEWHDECFRCAVCSGGFADGQIFPREGAGGLMQVVCTGCRQRELKA